MADDAISALFDGAQGIEQKNCSKCGVLKPLSEFSKSSQTKSGVRAQCKECASAHEAARRADAGSIAVGQPTRCLECGIDFPRKRGPSKYCADCLRIRQLAAKRESSKRHEAKRTEPRKRDPEKRKVIQARFIERHPEYRKEQSRKYNEANRDRINAKSRERSKRPEVRAARAELDAKYRSKPKNRVDQRMKTAIKLALRGKKAGRAWESLVGYTIDDLYAHLEKQFLPGMSWENMGEWHIDHIRPKSSFDYEDDKSAAFLECWALTNLQPLWAEDNLSKGDKRLFLI